MGSLIPQPPFDLNVVYSWLPTLFYSQVLPEFSSARFEIMLASKQPSVIIQKSKLAVTRLKKYRAKSTDPLKSMEIADYNPITHPYTQSYETKLTCESLPEEESKPAMMLSTENIFCQLKLLTPVYSQKRTHSI